MARIIMSGPTTDHAEIRRWARTTNAKPAEVFPAAFDGEPAILRFVFDTAPAGRVRIISWESFFAMFDLLKLALVYDGDREYELLTIQEPPPKEYWFEGKPMGMTRH